MQIDIPIVTLMLFGGDDTIIVSVCRHYGSDRLRRPALLFIAVIFAVSAIFVVVDKDGVAFAQEQNETAIISTVAKVRDVLADENDWSIATEKEPASADAYTEEILNEEADARIRKEEKKAEDKAKKQAKIEAKALAEELVENGRYKELIGYDSRYVMLLDENDDTYYEKLATRYPSIDEFWFEEGGEYHYEYDADYDDIDYSDRYDYVNHDTFHVMDTLTYRGLNPGIKYIVDASLIYADYFDSDPAEDDIVKTINVDFTAAAEEGSGTVELDFGELKLEGGNYVIFLTARSEDGSQVIDQKDPNDIQETIFIDDLDSNRIDTKAADSFNRTEEGKITFPRDGSPNTGDGAKATIQAVLLMMMALCTAMATIRRKSNQQ